MKRVAGVILITLSLSYTLLARNTSSATVKFSKPVRVGANTLSAGDYKMQWSGPGPDVFVTFIREGRIAVVAPAVIVPADNDRYATYTSEAVGVDTTQDGRRATVLAYILLRHVDLWFDRNVQVLKW
jgi:hypothetical protein